MTLGAVQVEDVVLADRKGRRFYALVTGKGQRKLMVEPIDRRVSYGLRAPRQPPAGG